MRKVFVRRAKYATVDADDQERLVALVATGLERLLRGQAQENGVDFVADLSVTTDCPVLGREGEE